MRLLIGLLALPLIASSCAVAPIATPRAGAVRVSQAAPSLYPVQAGTVWAYQTLQKRPDGTFSEKWLKMSVTSAREVGDGVTEAALERESPSGQLPPTRVRVHPDKVVLTRLAAPPDGPSLTIMRLPPTAGEAWPGRPYTNGNRETILPQGWEEVVVPAGTFRAWRVDHRVEYAQGGSDTLQYWYAPGVGTVKMVERLTLWMGPTPTHLEVTANLTSVTPGGPGARPTDSLATERRGAPGLWLAPDAP